MTGDTFKPSEPLFQRGFGQASINGTGLDVQLTRGKDQAVSPSLKRQAMLRQNSAERLPVPRILQIRKAGTLYPAGERLYVPRPLHVDGRVGPGLCSERMIVHA